MSKHGGGDVDNTDNNAISNNDTEVHDGTYRVVISSRP